MTVMLPRLGGLWRNSEFVKAWVGATISAIGGQVTLLAVPLTAVLVFGAGPAETGLLTAAGMAPTLLLGLLAGAWVDRLPRRPVRIVADLISAAVVMTVPALAVTGNLRLEHLYGVAFLVGCCAIWSRLSVATLLPVLVGRQNLLEANSKLIASFSIAQVVGPSFAGLLVQIVSPPLALLADAFSFVVSAVCFWRVRVPEPERDAIERVGLWREILVGLRWLGSEPILLRLTVSLGLANMGWFGVQAVVVVYATDDLGLSPALLGLSLAAIGPSSLVGAVVSARVAQRFGLGPTLVVSLCGELASRLVLLAAGGPPWLAALGLGLSQTVFGFIAPLWDVNAGTLRQATTPERLLGRVSAASTFVGVGMGPIGALTAGWIGQIAGSRTAVAETALVTAIAVLVLVWSPVPRLREATAAVGPGSRRDP